MRYDMDNSTEPNRTVGYRRSLSILLVCYLTILFYCFPLELIAGTSLAAARSVGRLRCVAFEMSCLSSFFYLFYLFGWRMSTYGGIGDGSRTSSLCHRPYLGVVTPAVLRQDDRGNNSNKWCPRFFFFLSKAAPSSIFENERESFGRSVGYCRK